MNKTVIIGFALFASGVFATQTVHAADTPATTGTTDAEFTVVAGLPDTDNPGGDAGTGADQDLILAHVPDLNFGAAKIADLIDGKTLNYVDGTVKKPTGDPAEATDGTLEVLDYRGTNAGWTVSASMDQLTNGQSSLDATLNFVAAQQKFTNAPATAALTAQIASDQTVKPVWTAAQAQGEGDNVAQVTAPTGQAAGTDLQLAKNTSATPGQYDATLTWTLADTPNTGA